MDNKVSITQRFVETMIKRVKEDTACRAALRHADNPTTESRAWEYIYPFCRLESIVERKVFCLTAAAIARVTPEGDGHMSIGRALRSVCTGNSEDDLSTELARLRRLLACHDSLELVNLIRHILRYLQTKDAPVSYERALRDALYWNESVRINWTKDFFHVREEKEQGVANVSDQA